MGCYNLFMNPEALVETYQLLTNVEQQQELHWVWKLFFDRALSREGILEGVLLVCRVVPDIPLSFKL